MEETKKNNSAFKALKQSKNRNKRNRAIKSKVRTYKNKYLALISNNNYKDGLRLLSILQSLISKAATKNVFNSNKASRMISSMHKKIKVLETTLI